MWVVSYYDRDDLEWRRSRRFDGEFQDFDSARIAVLRRVNVDQSLNNMRYCVHEQDQGFWGFCLDGDPHPYFRRTMPENFLDEVNSVDNRAANLVFAEVISLNHPNAIYTPSPYNPILEPMMPTTPAIPVTLAVPPTQDNSANSANPAQFAAISIKRSPGDNRLVLSVNAKPLHDLLDAIGVSHGELMYDNRPPVNYQIVNGTTLSSELFLKRQYPVQVNLSGVFSQPPTMEKLRSVCESGYQVIRTILNHYQPIDISVNIHKKLAG